ncbi:hypothetical protein [Radiobacillus deserti]|uniref:Uncharacterized protein n=1 Tax=Radiobacillus deserti TaxID=2594883 RepID=A0A516KFQ1_9BACI|nr:hypothetical protein [Radiobacillus deserti]QDP40235.1 hypothetical protein FN924_08640 [Radiobacillus deserti]
MKERRLFWLSIIICIVTVITIGIISIGGFKSSSDSLATVEANLNSNYSRTFQDLGIGMAQDFHLTLPHADKTWVKIWIDAYQNGKEYESNPVSALSYGMSPNQYEEGHMGVGVIKGEDGDQQLVLYAPNIKMKPIEIPIPMELTAGGYIANYAIGEEEIYLEEGETKVLAAQRTLKNAASIRDWNNQEDKQKMIEESETVLLLNIEVNKQMPDSN